MRKALTPTTYSQYICHKLNALIPRSWFYRLPLSTSFNVACSFVQRIGSTSPSRKLIKKCSERAEVTSLALPLTVNNEVIKGTPWNI